MRPLHAILTILAVAFATSCVGDAYRYTGYRRIPDSLWAYGDTLAFNVTLPGSAATGTLLLDITHDNTYPYSNLWLELSRFESDTILRDTLNVELCDPAGHWFGKGIEGHYQLETPVLSAVTLRDSSFIALRHIMRVDTVSGISQVGLTLFNND